MISTGSAALSVFQAADASALPFPSGPTARRASISGEADAEKGSAASTRVRGRKIRLFMSAHSRRFDWPDARESRNLFP